MEAKEFICITGWSVWHALKLLRGDDLSIDGRTIGEILKDKANNGVKVFVMVWREKVDTSKVTGDTIMGTFYNETYDYFKRNSKVICVKVPR